MTYNFFNARFKIIDDDGDENVILFFENAQCFCSFLLFRLYYSL